jgi:transcription-repair coupling factor (superfamily II helicase)
LSVAINKSINELADILNRLKSSVPFISLSQELSVEKDGPISVSGLFGSATSLLIKSLIDTQDKQILAVTQTSEEAADLFDDLAYLLGSQKVGHFPARQILPYDFRPPVGEIIGRRISTLVGMQDKTLSAVVCPIRALLEPTMPQSLLTESRITIQTGEELDFQTLMRKLLGLGFKRVPVVEEVGDFSLRGGVIDFFSPAAEVPARVELFGDTVDTIRLFSVGSQRTIEKRKEISILPKREVPITQETIEKHLLKLPESDAEYIRERYVNDPELPGLEWMAVMFGFEKGNLLDFLDNEAVVFLDGEGKIRDEIDSILSEGEDLYKRQKAEIKSLPRPEEYYFKQSFLFEKLEKHSTIDRLPFRGGRTDIIDFDCGPHPSFAGKVERLIEALNEFESSDFKYLIAADSPGQKGRLEELINEKSENQLSPRIQIADLNGGFVCHSGKYAILTDHEIFQRHHRRIRKKKFQEGVAIVDYSSLNQGDYVVHTEYGIARYAGLKTLIIDNQPRDCLLLMYAENDKLYVPIEEFNRVAKYAGKDAPPNLSRLGGSAWEKLKARTKASIAEMAGELIKLYAERKLNPGYAYGEDSVWMKQLEASFIYEETPDQQKAIDDCKQDLADAKPMDRLVCGDVGYGKTEVAVRAAFKVIDKGKQAAVLVPTTVLAQQHFQTFRERLLEFPVRVEMLSRFRTKQEQLKVVQGLATGNVELVIGTHRLLSKDISFKDLGILIIDEEHRFGVKHKERLRQLRASVDTMSMTATPIPRTLQMSLMGARDMSLINTSPKNRRPIITEIVDDDDAIIATSILREVDRGGQVFFVHNRVQSIQAMYRRLKKILPQVEIAIGHGQMHERELEKVMIDFMDKKYDVLLCTAIIESGLDIPSANTIIINRADKFGLAQLYQLRGRVGRSSQQAYAYLITPPIKSLTAEAVKRLRALEAHSNLGSGFALAMRDLEIRGAGTILGPRQSGFMEELGYDLYNKLLEEAVAELKGQPIQKLPETKIETDIVMHLSDFYINDRQQKVDLYRRLADSRSLDDVEKIREEITDRFGKMPQEAVNLIDGTALKVTASTLDIERIRLKSGRAVVQFREGRKLTRNEVESLRQASEAPMEFSFANLNSVTIDLGSVNSHEKLSHLKKLINSI